MSSTSNTSSLLLSPSWNPYHRQRRQTRVVMVGSVAVGGDNPIRVQSMTTTPTDDTMATVEQTLRLVDVGCEIVRITAPTVLDAKNLENIKNELLRRNCTVPLVADIHFRPDAAMEAANFVEKVRVNPGNFVDGKAFKIREYSDDQYHDELKRIEDKFTPLVLKLKKLKRALRIGTNHGSLSDRVMNRYGDTPLGMVESALEFLRVCIKNDYHDVIFSMKASNPRVMISAYRMLTDRLAENNWNYPFHLGVTEAGYAEDGRIKSAVGIGSLLEDGIGDTIRVSLTEDPEREVPVAYQLVRRYFPTQSSSSVSSPEILSAETPYVEDRTNIGRRETGEAQFGPIVTGKQAPLRVVTRLTLNDSAAQRVMDLLEQRVKKDTPPEILLIRHDGSSSFAQKFTAFHEALQFQTSRLAFWIELPKTSQSSDLSLAADGFVWEVAEESPSPEFEKIQTACARANKGLILKASTVKPLVAHAEALRRAPFPVMLTLSHAYVVQPWRTLVAELKQQGLAFPLLLSFDQPEVTLNVACVMGSLICDGIGDAIWTTSDEISSTVLDFSYNLLQGAGSRVTKTEYVSCPSCGRTLFDLQSTTERIKSQTSHLKGVKIAIMGCIVNGPGEMADADFGYVGGGPGKINLYVGKACVEKSIPFELADQKLIELIKTHGKWVDPS